MAGEMNRGVPLSTLCPKFLHTNSTSHTWPFSAIAELIDNAYDPDVNAKQFWIDKTVVQGQECLSFMDNGNGLDYETMHKMLSFGYSDKTAINGQEPIGIYGNGFKSGSMRLGKDAIVFSKSKSTSCVGMLSQTYLDKISAKQIIVPIVCFEQGAAKKHSVREEHKASLQDILCYSPFKTEEELLVEIDAITSSGSTGTTGSRIIIWNLRCTSTGTTEFDFEKDRYDIQIPSDFYETMDGSSHNQGATSHRPESDYSLRAYTSILYLKPRMQIIIRGQKVKSQLIAKSLAFIRKDHYRPVSLSKRIPITFGYNTKSKDQCGIMMYHKNRLIKAYERVACQLKVDIKGDGVIGVIECNYLDPTHNKQSFIETDKYRKTMNSLGIKLEEYWNEIRHKRSKENPNSLPVEDTVKRPDQNWAQCNDCQKWRKLPDGIDCSKLPDEWFCRLNPDPQFRSCLVEEEREDSDDEQQSYRKTYKQQEREKKKNQEKKREMYEEARKRLEAQRVAELTRQNQALKQQLHQKPPHFPISPATQRSRVNTESAARSESLPFSQAACRPSSSSGLPVISNVCSLSTGLQRGKRARPASPQRTPKTPKANSFHLAASDTSTFSNACPLSSPSVAVGDSPDDSDDDIVILETSSTPKPQNPSFHLSKVKTERTEGSDDDYALDVSLRQNAAGRDCTGSAAAGASPSITTQVEMTSTPTQTERPKVKTEEEEEALNETEGTPSGRKSIDWDMNFSLEQQGILNRASPSYIAEIQNQPDQLVELMQERDSYKEQVRKLTAQLRDAQSRLQELSRVTVKKECSHQAGQMQEAEGGEHCKTLSKTQTGNKSIADEEASLASAQAEPGAVKVEDAVIDEIALQVDYLMRELDQRNKERDELLSQVQSLKEEKVSLVSQCEELRMKLLQQRENTQEGSTTPHKKQIKRGQHYPKV